MVGDCQHGMGDRPERHTVTSKCFDPNPNQQTQTMMRAALQRNIYMMMMPLASCGGQGLEFCPEGKNNPIVPSNMA